MFSCMNAIDFKFGEKHLSYMRRAEGCVMNVAEGAVRAGKTVDNLFVFAALLDASPDRIHLATGSTAANARLNLGDCNGFGLEWIFGGRCRWGRYKGCDALTVQTPRGERAILFAGGKNADSFKKIRGLSIGMWIATEVNLHHPSMIREAFSRQLAAKDRRVFWDLNPDTPASSIYRDFLDVYDKKAREGILPGNFYNYCHFTIFDNETIGREQLDAILAQYDPGSLWYRRDIEGERCAAEGMIYTRFASDPRRYTVSKADMEPLSFITVGVDFGGNRSKTAFVACGFTKDFSRVYVLADGILPGDAGELTSDSVNGYAASFVGRLSNEYPGVPIRYMFCDSAEQYLIAGLRRHLRGGRGRYSVPVVNARKMPIRERIACTVSLFASGRLFLLEGCSHVASGLSGAVWDRDGVSRLDDFTSDIDSLDAFEYAFEGYLKRLLPERT